MRILDVFLSLDGSDCHLTVSRFDDQLPNEKAVFTLGSIALPDKKLESNYYQFTIV